MADLGYSVLFVCLFCFNQFYLCWHLTNKVVYWIACLRPGHLTGGLGADLAGWLAGGGRHGWWTAWLAGGAGLATDLDGWLVDWWTGNGSVPEWHGWNGIASQASPPPFGGRAILRVTESLTTIMIVCSS